jgi:predicted RNA-binding protein with PIN domain
MALLIDGYNLLHVTGITGHGKDLTELHGSREALLRFLAESIEPIERAHTTIVFDAAGAPPGLPQTLVHDSITVHFARDYADADAMIEDLIAAHHTPRTLVVVSSDHRIQRAARRRRAKAVDSDRWYAELWAARHRRGQPSLELLQKPGGELSAAEVSYWTKQFSDDVPSELPSGSDRRPAKEEKPSDDFNNPFPPGYAEDLLDEVD